MLARRAFLQSIGLGGVLSGRFSSTQPNRSNPPHLSMQQSRRMMLFPERIYAEEWEKANERHPAVNSGFTLLEWILCPSGCPVPPEVSERDAAVAACIIQWLGTNCGLAFMQCCEKRIIQEREANKKKPWPNDTFSKHGMLFREYEEQS